jgi:hypothetical protein
MGNLECDEKGNMFCDFQQCVIATWQIILWFKALCERYMAKYSVVSNKM